MKKWLCLFLLFPTLLLAEVDTFEGQAVTTSTEIEGCASCDTSEGQAVSVGGVDYSDILFHYNMENSADSDKPSGGSAITGTTNSSWAYDGVVYQVGSYAGDRPGASDGITFALTDAVFNEAEGQLGFWFLYTDWSAYDWFVEVNYDGSNYFRIMRASTAKMYAKWQSGGAEDESLTHGTTLTADTWYYIVFYYDIGGATTMKLSIYDTAGSEVGTTVTTATAIGSWGSPADSLVIGETNSDSHDVHFDNLIISNDIARDMVAIRAVEDFN